MQDEFRKSRLFSRRAFLLIILKLLMLIVIFSRYFYLQIIDAVKYKILSDRNRIKLILTTPIRGEIIDRKGLELASNNLKYQLVIDSRNVELLYDYTQRLSKLLDTKEPPSQSDIIRKLNKIEKGRYFPLFTNLNWEEMAKVQVHFRNFPGLVIDNDQHRFYPEKETAAHITGYVGSQSKQDAEAFRTRTISKLEVGKNGVEKIFNEALTGSLGLKKVEVDALGRSVREISETPPQPGNIIKLSIDLELQRYIANLLGQHDSSAVVVKIPTGEVLAIHSSPPYDPNLFIGGISSKDWHNLVSASGTPLINKAISFPYPPGSPFKAVTGLAGLEKGITPDLKVFCNGKHKIGNHTFHCWNKHGHGNVDFKLAITQSCNIYFYTIAEKIGIENIAKTALQLGLGRKTGIELPYENSGLVPDPDWKLKNKKKPWFKGDTINSCIGQGFVLATPIQLAVMTARIATGKLVTPVINFDHNNFNLPPLRFKEENLQLLREAMSMVFNDYRGNSYQYRFTDKDFILAGKTGTSQVISQRKANKKRFEDHGLFTGFAPFDNPRYAISVIIEHGSWGSQSALPIAVNIFKKLKELKI